MLPRIAIIYRSLAARPRLVASLLFGLLTSLLIPLHWVPQPLTRAIIGWNAGASLYLALSARMMFFDTHERMRHRARQQDEGRLVVLCMVILTALIALSGVVAQLSLAKNYSGMLKYAHVALAGYTLMTSWAFTQCMFALHYAHDYYLAEDQGHPKALDFPGGHLPDYGDFLYFACVIGTSGQTADVSFTNRSLRRIGLLHCVLAFVFNTTILALTINIASSLI